jgi:CheY-like chemotaxis protein
MFARIAAAERMVSVGTLAAGVAHEVNNPLAFVISNLALLEDALVSPERTQSPRLTSADVATLLRDAREGASRVATIVRDLRSLSRVEPENEARGAVDIRRALQFSLKMAETQTRNRAHVVAVLEDDLPPVDADEPRVGQVFLNLLVNAAQAISSGSAQDNEIRVHARATADRSAVLVDVEDTGEGIPESLHARIFDPFFTTKPAGVATGLGLAICHGIVKRFGGEIALVSSAPGQGTRIRVTLPAAATHPSPPCVSPGTSTHSELRARVLLIDDEPSLGRTVQILLQRDHDVVTVVHARHAIELLEKGERFDVIFCDLMMPEMSGIDFHARIASSAPTFLNRIVFLTGGAFTDQTRAYLAGLPNQTIEKPFSEACLRDAISQALTATGQV